MNMNLPPIQHFELLREYDRTLSLKAAISKVVKQGDIVLDAGCGTGILGLLALKAGAKKVVAVDSQNLSFAKALAAENNLIDSIEYIQADFDTLDLKILPRFDVILAMLYSGHPIFDEGQVSLKNRIYEKFLLPNGKLIPNRVKWHAYVCDWQIHDFSQRTRQFEHAISDLTHQLGLHFQPSWATELSQIQAWQCVVDPYECTQEIHDLKDFFSESSNAKLKLLSKRTDVADIEYGKITALLPDTINFEIIQSGQTTTILWIRELWFEDILISSRNSISLVEKPISVDLHKNYTIALDQAWKSTNIISQYHLAS